MSSKSGNRWLRQRRQDAWVRKAQQSPYRSRAVYKLKEIDERDRLLRRGQTVVDLGASPGSWSQYAAPRVGNAGRLLAVDIAPMEAIAGVCFIAGDFSDERVRGQCLDWLAGGRADLVLCDIAPNISGIRDVDQARSMALARCAADFSCRVLGRGGDLLIKVFAGAGQEEYTAHLRGRFARVLARKPRASKPASRESYILARRCTGAIGE